MHHPAWELVATQIDHEESAPSQAAYRCRSQAMASEGTPCCKVA
jgi:hypothetical protein